MSPGGESDSTPGPSKRRKVPRACDYCRKRKIRCDGPVRGGDAETGIGAKCSPCTEMGSACTYIKEAQRKGPPRGYLTMLQERCARLENLVHQLRPSVDIESNVGPPLDHDNFDLEAYRSQLEGLGIPPFPTCKSVTSTDIARTVDGAGSTSRVDTITLSAPRLPTVELFTPGRLPDFASPLSDTSTAGSEAKPDPFMVTTSVRSMVSSDNSSLQFHGRTATTDLMRAINVDMAAIEHELEQVKSRRAKLWKQPEWEVVVNNTGQRPIDWSIWPDDDLAFTLMDAYFEWVNCTLPLLHRPLFRQQYFARLYTTDHDFAKLCLVMFANGARFVYAPLAQWRRAQDIGHLTSPERPNDGVLFSDGWKYIRGLMSAGDSLHKAPTLFRLQTAVLLSTFLHGNTDSTIPWAVIGATLRGAQEIGLHLAGESGSPSALPDRLGATGGERQLLLRAFWCLYHLDRSYCVSLGRSVALHDADIATAYPLDADDEWDGDDSISPPAGASKINAFLHILQLDRIVSGILTTLPARREAREAASTRLPAVLIELASALNRWEEGLPRSLRWQRPSQMQHPGRPPNVPHFLRTAHLHARYHWTRIFVHWAPLAAEARRSKEPLPPRAVLDTVVESARAIFEVCSALLALEVFQAGTQRPIPLQFLDYAWVAGAVTLFAIGSGAEVSTTLEDAFSGVGIAVATLHQMECVSRNAGQAADMLAVMARAVRSASVSDTLRLLQHRVVPESMPDPTSSTSHPVALELPSTMPTPDLSWLNDELFMAPYATTGVASGVNTGTPGSKVGGTGPWASLFETLVTEMRPEAAPGESLP